MPNRASSRPARKPARRVSEVRVTTWLDLMREIYADPINRELQRYRPPFAYRGMTNVDFGLEPSLLRVGEHFAAVERLLLSDFMHYAYRDAAPGNSFWNWMSVAAHRGLPTRLIDWTYSPFVALHFATANLGAGEPGSDAVLWAVNYVETNKMLSDPLVRALREGGKSIFTVEMLDAAVPDLDALDGLQDYEFVLFMEPPSLDDRIVNQAALFSVMSRPSRAGAPPAASRLDEFLVRKQHDLGPNLPNLFRRIVIAADLKWEIRDRLDQANINERMLFPGMDGLAAWLKRHYTKRGGRVLATDEHGPVDVTRRHMLPDEDLEPERPRARRSARKM
jgi:hypothetical protein